MLKTVNIYNFLIILFVRSLLWLRYRVRVQGLSKIVQKGRSGILFLPNHPALIDPFIVLSQLYPPFKVRTLADRDQIDRFLIRYFAKRIKVLPVPDIAQTGSSSATEVRKMLNQCVEILRQGENLFLYPSGRIYRQYLEDIRGNSAVERILQEVPNARIVLVRTRGLWGSGFSWASGQAPSVRQILWNGVKSLLVSGIVFAPRRQVNIELVEPNDFPLGTSRQNINTYLQDFYNDDAPGNIYVPYTIWEPGGVNQLPEPVGSRLFHHKRK